MELIEAEFVEDEQVDQQADGDADGEPQDIDEGEDFIFRQVPPGDDEIVFYHGGQFTLGISHQLNAGLYNFVYQEVTIDPAPQVFAIDTGTVRVRSALNHRTMDFLRNFILNQ